MKNKMTIGKRAVSLVVALALLISLIPMFALDAAAAEISTADRVADPATMDGWKQFFPTTGEISTENAGGVWVDKSVFTDATAFGGLIKQDRTDSFLVALSAIASNMSITGMSNIPTDTMLVLDVSGSMNDNAGNNDVAEELVEAANESIAALLGANKHNRVGVVLYSGPATQGGATSASDAILVLPLGRYTTGSDEKYLSYNVTSSGGRNPSTTETVSLNPNVKIENSESAPAAKEKEVVGGTYIQKGIALAMTQFTAEGNAVTVEDPVMGTLKRKPVMVLMSDGAPTVGSTNFTAPDAIALGDGTATSAALGFVSQLTAAYAKAQMQAKYGTEALFYTLGIGIGSEPIALSVLDPDNSSASTAVGDFWKQYDAANAGATVTVQSGGRGRPAKTVTKIETVLVQNYVDRYFAVDGTNGNLADGLKQAFKDIVGTIQLQSSYFPTLISESEELSGYVSFVDRVGQYMEVTDVKGILIGDHLFSGADLASNFVSGGGALGTFENPNALGQEMVAAVRARLGLDSDDTARTLIALAYENGQLSYTDANNYSNYIGWYANAAGQFLGFYHEGVTKLPAATGNVSTDPAFVIKSYGYLGEVDASHGVTESDMMYATVQVRENIATGEQLVTFAVPAALIPVVSYEVTLNEKGALTALNVNGADKPIRLVYEVALEEGINAYNLKEKVSAEYLADVHNVNADGSINFYTNQWDHENTTGYGTINTYSYFNPSRQNDKYYYLEDTPVYADTNGTPYTGETQPAGTVYRAYVVYKNNGSLRAETVYRPLSDAAKATAVRGEDGTWYIPKGNVHVNLDGYTVVKTENKTGTLAQSNIPFVDTKNHSIDEVGYEFYVGATLGNNGKLTVKPQTGIKLSKTMAPNATAPTAAFTFSLTNTTNAQDNSAYPAWLNKADGTEKEMTVQFENGMATVELHAGDVLYIGGMKAGDSFRITEKETIQYVATAEGLTEAGTVTLVEGSILPVSFVNADRGTGNLTIAKEVEHSFGVNYQIPSDKVFTMEVTLSGIGTANATFTAKHTNGTYTQITTDANGKFTVQLKHEEQFEVFGLPVGATATVVETKFDTGFTPAYWDNGVAGDGVVTVAADSTVSVTVVNDYKAAEVYPVGITVSGNKTLNGRQWQEGDKFDFVLQKLLADGTWQQLGETASAVSNATGFTFADAFKNERYTEAGTYYYRVIEIEPATPTGGVQYDKTVHSFAVIVADADMDGKLEIAEVRTDRPETTTISGDATKGWTVLAKFTNTYSTTGSATVTIDVNKVIENKGGAEKSLADFTFGLFDPNTNAMIGNALTTTDRGFARFALTYGTEDIGKTYTYILKEIAPQSIPAGWTYSTQAITVTVKVIDQGDGTMSAVIYTGTQQPENAGASIAATFTNTYDPKDAELVIDFVKKELAGRDQVKGEFSFVLRDEKGNTLLTGTNEANGNVTFNDVLKFTAVGTHIYEIVETSQDGKGITTDKTVYRIQVTVTDVNGELKVTYVLLNAVGDVAVFRNTYTAQAAEHSIRGSKILSGRTLLNDEFTFVLKHLTLDGVAVENGASWTVKNFADGSFVFPAIRFTKVGTYTYSVEEVRPEDGSAYGITYDKTVFWVTVVVKDDGEGKLYIDSQTVTLPESSEKVALEFVNKYIPAGTSAQFSGEKQLTGKVDNGLSGGEFEFELYNSNANWERVSLREWVANGKNGIITFTKIDFNTAGDQYFIVVERNGGQTINGITYDDTVYRVYVQITDDLKGQLHATVHIYDGEGVPQDRIRFVNTYQVTGGASVELSGEKTLSGRDFQDTDSFTFELYEADENYAIGQTPKATANMNAAHRFSFTLNYTAQDAGKTFYYVVKEYNGGQTIDRVTYSTQQYRIKVEVQDNTTGGIRTIVTVENATTTTLNFVNVYVPKPTDLPVEILVQKTVVNKGSERIGPEGFAFLLDALDEGGKDTTVRSDAQGNAKFALLFTEADIGKVYNYRLTEIDEKAANVTYSQAVYEISIAITLNENNELLAEITVNGEKTSQAVAAFENVYDYTPQLPQTGDETAIALWLLMMCLSSGAALMMLTRRKRRMA